MLGGGGEIKEIKREGKKEEWGKGLMDPTWINVVNEILGKNSCAGL